MLGLIVGGTTPRLAEVAGRIHTRQMLSLTLIFDHDVVDGVPAAPFTRRLVELIESGYGLDKSPFLTPAVPQPAAVQSG